MPSKNIRKHTLSKFNAIEYCYFAIETFGLKFKLWLTVLTKKI